MYVATNVFSLTSIYIEASSLCMSTFTDQHALYPLSN